jgi:hypothetical protein
MLFFKAQVMSRNISYLIAFTVGTALAYIFTLLLWGLDAYAFQRSTVLEQEHARIAAAIWHITLRHLPIFVGAFVVGLAMFRVLRQASYALALVAALPWLLFIVGISAFEGFQLGQNPILWFVQAPLYVAWPNFITVPAGFLSAAGVMRQMGNSPNAVTGSLKK